MNLGNLENKWFALLVRTGYEQVCGRILQSKGYEEFVPLSVPPVSGSRKPAKTSTQALFPGYIFCKLPAKVQGLIVTTPGVIRVVGYGRVPVAIDEQEIENIQRLVHSGRRTYACPYFQKGQRIRIMSGALCGVTGTLIRAKNLHKLIVSVDLLQRSVAVELDADCLASLDLPHQGRSETNLLCVS